MPRISRAREEAVRARILDAGLRVFDAQGFRQASMAAIAAEAGLSAGAIYTWFDSKEALFLAAFAALVAEEEQRMEAALLATPSTAERVRLAIDLFVERGMLLEQPGFRGTGGGFLLHGWANAAGSATLRGHLVARRAHVESLARRIITDGIAAGEIPPGLDVDGVAAGIVGMFDGLLLQRAEQGVAFTADAARRQARAVIEGLLRR